MRTEFHHENCLFFFFRPLGTQWIDSGVNSMLIYFHKTQKKMNAILTALLYRRIKAPTYPIPMGAFDALSVNS